MKTKPIINIDNGYFTFLDGRRVETDDINVYGIESRPHTRETDSDCCEIGSLLVRDEGASEWRDVTEEELEEINDDSAYMSDIVWNIVEDLTTD